MGWFTVPAPARALTEAAAARLLRELGSGRGYKVRVQAALLLARARRPEAVPALSRALAEDREPVVRSVAARLLADNPGGAPDGTVAHEALVRAADDKAPEVRRAVKVALATLERKVGTLRAVPVMDRAERTPLVAVRVMGDRTGHASPALRKRAREALISELGRTRGVRVTTSASDAKSGLVIDGVVTKLVQADVKLDTEVTCGVELLVSRPPHGIVMVASGEATVQKPARQVRPGHRAVMQEEAAAHAVRSANENLRSFLAALPR